MFWNVAAFFAGAFCGAAVNMMLIQLNGVFFPPPVALDYSDPAALDAYVANLPLVALLVVIVAHLAQAFVGGWVGARLAAHAMPMALVLGVFSMIGGIANLMMITHPTWMWIEVPLYLVAAYAAGRIEVTRRARVGASAGDGPSAA